MKVLPQILLCLLCLPKSMHSSVLDFMKCKFCQIVQPSGKVSDCACDFRTVDGAVHSYYVPLLKDLTSRAFFRYFFVDLERPCPFWHEDAQCMMEGCSVCACDEEEIPKTWLELNEEDIKPTESNVSPLYGDIDEDAPEFGWIYPNRIVSELGDIRDLEHLNLNNVNADGGYGNNYIQYLNSGDARNQEDWIDMPEQRDFKRGVYVNLLQNPEKFTGYSGPSARRVWNSIWQENCFADQNDVCMEKRVFYRLLSGLQASISSHIAREYYYPDGKWGQNIPLFVTAVGAHPDRLNNLYFTFLFVLRAVAKSGDYLGSYRFETGNSTDDTVVQNLVEALVQSGLSSQLINSRDVQGNTFREAMVGLIPNADTRPSDSATHPSRGYVSENDSSTYLLNMQSVGTTIMDTLTHYHRSIANLMKSFVCSTPEIVYLWKLILGVHPCISPQSPQPIVQALEQCRNGFDESQLFQVHDPDNWPVAQYGSAMIDAASVKEQFREHFRNISRIMDCVSCEKCRVWGKLQILGLGTAIKILLTPEEELTEGIEMAASMSEDTDQSGDAPTPVLTRQEVIALVNTLHQLAKSVEFASVAAEHELAMKLQLWGKRLITAIFVLILTGAILQQIMKKSFGASFDKESAISADSTSGEARSADIDENEGTTSPEESDAADSDVYSTEKESNTSMKNRRTRNLSKTSKKLHAKTPENTKARDDRFAAIRAEAHENERVRLAELAEQRRAKAETSSSSAREPTTKKKK